MQNRKVVETKIVQAPLGTTPGSVSPDEVYGKLAKLYADGWDLFETHVLGYNPKVTDYSFVLVKYAKEAKGKK